MITSAGWRHVPTASYVSEKLYPGLRIYRRPSSCALIKASWRDEMVSF